VIIEKGRKLIKPQKKLMYLTILEITSHGELRRDEIPYFIDIIKLMKNMKSTSFKFKFIKFGFLKLPKVYF
jgi:hypothetical protein